MTARATTYTTPCFVLQTKKLCAASGEIYGMFYYCREKRAVTGYIANKIFF